jgi:phospholipase D1/2
MPFNERFWRPDEVMDEPLSWEAKARVKESAPINIQGFIVALPVSWTAGEDNSSNMNLTLLANNGRSENESRYFTSAGKDEHTNPEKWSQDGTAKPVV